MEKGRNLGTIAVLLAAGQGKRMKSALPKVLHDVLGKPIIKRVLDTLDQLPLDHIYIVLGHQADAVQAFLDKAPPATSWSTHLQEKQLGTGHALMQVAPVLGSGQHTVLVLPADTPLITETTLSALLAQHRHESSSVTVLTTMVDDPKNYGRIVRDGCGQVVKIVEAKDADAKQRTIKEINTAIYCLEWPIIKEGLATLRNDNQQSEYYLTDLISWAQERGLPIGSRMLADASEAHGINSRLELAEANSLLKDKVVTSLALESGVTIVDPASTWVAPDVEIGRETVIYPGCFITGEVCIGESCTIGPHTTLVGPVKIGDYTSVVQSLVANSAIGSNCRVGPFAHLRDGAEVSDHSRVGNFVEIKKSQVGSHTNVSHLSYVGDASLGVGVNIGAGTITANYNHLTKMKARTIVEDGASTGSNSVLVAPVNVGPEATVAAGTVVTKDVPAGALAVGRARQENKLGWLQKKQSQIEV